MECKVSAVHSGMVSSVQDLIETLWNVKLFFVLFSSAHISDLIETLWNVKVNGDVIFLIKAKI